MFKTRLLSGIVLVIAAIFLIVPGNEVLLFSTLLISCIGMFELFRVFKSFANLKCCGLLFRI